MTVTLKVLGAIVVVFAIAASHANAGQLRMRGHARYGHGDWKYQYTVRSYAQPQPDLGAAVAGALAGAALQLIPRATEALMAKLPPGASTPPATPPVVTAQAYGSPRAS